MKFSPINTVFLPAKEKFMSAFRPNFLQLIFILLLSVEAAWADGSQSIRNEPNNQGVIVFVHGILGNAVSTWTHAESKNYWPALLKEDPVFSGFNIYAYEYPTTLAKGNYSIDELAEDMRSDFNSNGVTRHSRIIIVAHSMGGLITRAYLLKYREVADKIDFIYFFGTPTTGSPGSTLGTIVSRNPQIGNMYPLERPDSALGPLQSAWLAAGFQIPSYCAYETVPTYGQMVVSRQSATNLCTKRLDPIAKNHLEIVKPRDRDDKPYKVFKEAFLEIEGKPQGLTAELRHEPDSSVLKLYISNQLPRLYEVENLALDWEYLKCPKIETVTVKRSLQTAEKDRILPYEVVTYSTNVAVTKRSGATHIKQFSSEKDFPPRPRKIDTFKYANGDMDSFYIFLTGMPAQAVGQQYRFKVSFDFKLPGERQAHKFTTEPVVSGSCTKTVQID